MLGQKLLEVTSQKQLHFKPVVFHFELEIGSQFFSFRVVKLDLSCIAIIW